MTSDSPLAVPTASQGLADGLGQRWSVLEHILSVIQMADAKATALMAVTALAMSILIGVGIDIAKTGYYRPSWLVWPATTFVLALVAFICLIVSLVFALICLIGRVGPPSWQRNGSLQRPPASLLFFGTIRRESREAYVARFEKVTEQGLLADLSGQIHILSTICWKKYWYLNGSYFALLASLAMFAVTLLVVVVGIVVATQP